MPRSPLSFTFWSTAALLFSLPLHPGRAQAQETFDLAPDAHAYALVVGSNAGGDGQEPLAYAERDAERIANVLAELGEYREDRIELLRSPSRAQMASSLSRLQRRLAAHRARDEQTVVFFYYSGHAQSQALRLGREQYPLNELRTAINALPSTLTLVVLDACQSGAYSRVRGAEPAADFSQNSIQQLQTRGVAVMASSSGDELSQESERLEAGYFTHHLLVALRGGADENHDGRVALDEAYRYAYAQTLVDTSRTAVGGQHVTLETALTGHGAVALTYPSRAAAQLELPADAAGQFLVTRANGGAIVAELHKAAGAAIRLALPAGRYQVLWRGEDQIRSCPITLRGRAVRTLNASECEEIDEEEARTRAASGEPRASWGIEIGGGAALRGRNSDYTDRIEAFGYNRPFFDWRWLPHLQVAVERSLTRYLGLALTFESLEARSYDRFFTGDADDSFSWRAWGLGLQLRATLPLAGRWLLGYVQGGGGLGIARTRFSPGSPQERSGVDAHYGVLLSVGAGIRFEPWKHVGFYLQASYRFAPILENDLGDGHDSGNVALATGLRIQF